jgi:hypothetical protein
MSDESVVPRLLTLTFAQLDEEFGRAPAGPIPDGAANGTAIIAPGTVFNHELAQIVSIVGWQGKTFDAAHGTLRNRILPFGLNAILAKVYHGASLLEGRECIVLDYSETSLIARWVRDEIRLIAPSTYLGRVYVGETALMHFALEFEPAIAPGY